MSDVDGKQLCDILRLNAGDSRFSAALDTLISWDSVSNTDVEGIVSAIITDVRQQGDSALLEYTNRFEVRKIVFCLTNSSILSPLTPVFSLLVSAVF